MLSFWEKESFLRYDFIIVGAGIVGLSAAAALAEQAPQARIAVLERGLLPTGASTKNAGFACFGSLTELLADLDERPADEVLALVEKRWRGLLRLRQRLGDERIGYEGLGGFELITQRELPDLHHLDRLNQWLKPLFGQEVYSLQNQSIAAYGFNTQHVKALVMNALEGQLHTGRMMRSLWDYCKQANIDIITGCQVTAVETQAQGVEIRAQSPLGGQALAFAAPRAAVCTNAFAPALLPCLDITPGRGQVLLTKPLSLRFRGAFHLDEGFYYFRNVGDRVLLGGGRNEDFEGETTTQMATTPRIMQKLEQVLQHIILPGQSVEIEQRWAGIMAFGQSKTPIVQATDPTGRLVVGARMGGMGVALGSLTGQEVAALLLGKPTA